MLAFPCNDFAAEEPGPAKEIQDLCTTRYGVTPLYLAATNGNAAVIAKLLEAGAGANSANPSGETALMTAARTGKVDAVKVLLDHGADVNARESVRQLTPPLFVDCRPPF